MTGGFSASNWYKPILHAVLIVGWWCCTRGCKLFSTAYYIGGNYVPPVLQCHHAVQHHNAVLHHNAIPHHNAVPYYNAVPYHNVVPHSDLSYSNTIVLQPALPQSTVPHRTPTHRTLSYYFCTSFRVHTASTIYNPNGVLGATLSDISNWIMVAIFSKNSVNIRWEFSKIQWEFSEHFSIKPRPTFKFGNIHEYAQIHPECEVS